jgi:hypothetical protein
LASLDRAIVTLVPRIYQYDLIELSNHWILFYTKAILKNSAECIGCFVNYLVYYVILCGMCSLTWGSASYAWISLSLFVGMFLGDVFRTSRKYPPRIDTTSHGNEGQDHSFKHKPFSGPGRIRLILLYPRHSLDPVKSSVMEASLDGLPLYEAISYTWGEFDKKFTVHVDEGEIQVPGNLYTLPKVRSSLWVPRLLWIDSISIDQTNDAEKKQQIQLMGDIYRKVCVVSVFLGFHTLPSTINEEFITSCFNNPVYARIALKGRGEAEEIFNRVDAHITLDILKELRLTNSELEEPTILGSIAG